jgi:hypothetical protein
LRKAAACFARESEESVAAAYRCAAAQKDNYEIALIFEARLVSRSEFYEWAFRPPSTVSSTTPTCPS